MPPRTIPKKDKILHSCPTSVTGAKLTVEESATGLRIIYLDGHEQSEVQVKKDGSLSMAQPLELVQVMSLVSLAWLHGGTAADPDAPNVLLIGIGGGSIARVLAATMPGSAAKIHSLDLEPEVVAAAVEYFGLPQTERCTAAAGDGAAYMKAYRRKTPKYDVLLLDAFTSEGLAASTQRQSTLDDAASCLSPNGLLIVNLHTGKKDDPDDDDYYVARRVLRALCVRFGAVYTIRCRTTWNLIALAHQGEMKDASEWDSRISSQFDNEIVRQACVGFSLPEVMEKFEYVGGKDDPMEEERGDLKLQ